MTSFRLRCFLVTTVTIFAFATLAQASEACSKPLVKSLKYSFVDSSIPNRRDVSLTLTGDKLSIRVTSGKKVVATFNATVPAEQQTAISELASDIESVGITGRMCPGAKQNKLTISAGAETITRVAATCSEDANAQAAFDQTEAVVAPLFALLGGRETVLKR